MYFPVYMLAFYNNRDKIRLVNVPEEHLTSFLKNGLIVYSNADVVPVLLELVFHYGQNDFQPQEMYSVSVGDVVRLHNGESWMVMGVGWRQLTNAEFDSLKAPTYSSCVIVF